jgi:hypothetical protein
MDESASNASSFLLVSMHAIEIEGLSRGPQFVGVFIEIFYELACLRLVRGGCGYDTVNVR